MDNNNSLSAIIGIWIPSDDGYYIRSTDFQSNKPGYEFKANGELIQRGNIGWCGTPPISYRNYVGKWKWIDNNTLFIESSNWRGPFTEKLKCQFLDKNMDKIKLE